MLFKNRYYCFIAGLPDFSFDSMKLPFTVNEFRGMLEEELKPEEMKLINKYFLKHDNDNLRHLLKAPDAVFSRSGQFSRQETEDLIRKIKEEESLRHTTFPPYFETVIRASLHDEPEKKEQPGYAKELEDTLASLYMDYGMGIKNSLISQWFEFNLNMGNIFSALFARKYGMDVAKAVVGNNHLAQIIREHANVRDFGIAIEVPYFENIQRLAEIDDLYDRERKIDKFRWDWLEAHTVFDYFNLENIFAYFCKLQILERWVNLNAEEGERIFRQLISNLKEKVRIPEEE